MSDVITHYEADDLVISIPVTFEPGSTITTLAGGTAVARARREGGTVVIGSAVIDPGGAEVIASWSESTLPIGKYTLQVRATKDGQSRTLISRSMIVEPSV